MRVDICIATFRRPEGLMRLLGAIQQLGFPAAAPELRVVVVDNDPRESARAVCEAARAWLTAPLVYGVEKRRGTAPARNTAIATSLGHSDFLVFLDDDEVPEPGWLAELLRVQEARGADAVAGPRRPRFDPKAPRWLIEGGFFDSPRLTTGTRIDCAFTHNVLVRTAALAEQGMLFDESFDDGLAGAGGCDAEFVQRLAGADRRIVWSERSVVHEWVPASRANLRWLLLHGYRVGLASGWVDRNRALRPVSRFRLLVQGGLCVVRGGTLLLLAALRGRRAAAGALRLACVGVGRIAALGERMGCEPAA